MSSANADVLHRWFEELWNQGNIEIIERLASPDAIGHGQIEQDGQINMVGKSKAIELMVVGNTFSFEEAKEMGIINDIYEREGFMHWILATLEAKTADIAKLLPPSAWFFAHSLSDDCLS